MPINDLRVLMIQNPPLVVPMQVTFHFNFMRDTQMKNIFIMLLTEFILDYESVGI